MGVGDSRGIRGGGWHTGGTRRERGVARGAQRNSWGAKKGLRVSVGVVIRYRGCGTEVER